MIHDVQRGKIMSMNSNFGYPDKKSTNSKGNCIRQRPTSKTIFAIAIVLAFQIESVAQNRYEFTLADTGMRPTITDDLKGGEYVIWENHKDAIHLRHLDSLGNQLQDTVSLPHTFASRVPRVATNEKYTVAVWEDDISNTIDYYSNWIYSYAYDKDSVNSGTFIIIDNGYRDANRYAPDAGFVNDSTFVTVWYGQGASTPLQTGIYAQISSISGTWTGDNTLVSDHTTGSTNSLRSRVITHEGKDFYIVTWEDNSSGRPEIYGRRINLNGNPSSPSFLISADSTMTNMFYYGVAKDTSGGFGVVWIATKGNLSQIEWRWYDNQGVPLTDVESVTPLDTLFDYGNTIDAAIDEKGRIVVVWEQNTIEGSKLLGQGFLANKSPKGNPFRISTMIPSGYQIYPSVVLKNDKIYTVFEDLWRNYPFGARASILNFDEVTSVGKNQDYPSTLPQSFILYPCFPNPFNPSTTIRFNVPTRSRVRLSIFNLLGQKIAELANEEIGAGYFERTWNANVASGMYFYRIEAVSVAEPNKRFVDVKKMVLLK